MSKDILVSAWLVVNFSTQNRYYLFCIPKFVTASESFQHEFVALRIFTQHKL